jgi:hypothetical protein
VSCSDFHLKQWVGSLAEVTLMSIRTLELSQLGSSLYLRPAFVRLPGFDYRKLYLNRTLRSERAEDDYISALYRAVLLLRQRLCG